MAILNASWFSLLVGTVIGVIGIWLAIVFYRRSRQITRLRHLMGDAPLIGSTPSSLSDGLEIRFDSKIVPRVTRTSYGLWNYGTTTIHGRDIVEADPLRLEFANDVQVLRATIESATRAVNAAAILGIRKNEVILGFDYLDQGDGFRVQIIHSGCPGSMQQKGTIRGLPKGIEALESQRAFRLVFAGCVGVGFILTLLIPGSVIALTVPLLVKWPSFQIAAPLFLIVVMLALAVTAAVSAYRAVGKPNEPLTTRGIPKEITDDPTLVGWSRRPDTESGVDASSRE